MNHKKVAVVTGSSSGIGLETSLMLSRAGFLTYATMRNLGNVSGLNEIVKKEGLDLTMLKLDVNNDYSVNEAINLIVEESKGIDVLVNNAGYALVGSVEELTIEEIKEQFETNFFGAIRSIKAVLPVMKKQRSGTIVNISSIAGKVGLPLNSPYVSTKFALEGFSESIRYELKEFGIELIVIEPGAIKSNFLNNAKMAKMIDTSHSDYGNLMKQLFDGFITIMKNASSPTKVAETILTAVTSKNKNFTYVVGDDAKSIIQSRKSMSEKEFEIWMKESILDHKGFNR